MACDSLLTTSLLQVLNKLVATLLSKLVIHRSSTSCVTSCNKLCLQMTSCNKPDFNRLVAILRLIISVKLTTSNHAVGEVFLQSVWHSLQLIYLLSVITNRKIALSIFI